MKKDRRTKPRPHKDRRGLPRPQSKLRNIEDITHTTIRKHGK
jgi:hypothetical protein